MALLAPQVIGEALAAVNFVAATVGGDTVARRDNSFLAVKNGSGAPITVTLDTPGTTHGLAIADEGVTIAAGAEAYISTSDPIFVHPSDNLIHIAYSAVATVTVAQVLA